LAARSRANGAEESPNRLAKPEKMPFKAHHQLSLILASVGMTKEEDASPFA
jgi:hypothetical protein